MNMKMQATILSDFSDDSKEKLLIVIKQILSKAELSTNANVIWFAPVGSDLTSSEYHSVITKLHDLWILEILDENYAGPPMVYPISYKLRVFIPTLRSEIKKLENNQPNETNVEIKWPETYRWDNTGLKFLLDDDKSLDFGGLNQSRRRVFNSLVERKGKPVRVSTISSENGINNEGKVRTIINQIRDRINKNKLGKYLRIEALGINKAGIHGSYRIVPA